MNAVARFLRPRSVAIVGMSARAGSVGRIILESLKVNEFAGDIHLVGRSTEPIDGRPVLQSVDELPEGVDLAVFALPASAVRDAVESCVRRKVASALVFAAGFAETGGVDEQEAIAHIARAGGLAIVGPNCLGFTNNVDGVDINMLRPTVAGRFVDGAERGVAFIGQSGGLLGHWQRAAAVRRMPLSYVITTGNEAGLQATDFVEYLAGDRATNVIALYAEHVAHPGAFLGACRRAREAGKAIVMLHPGRSAKAREATRSHTGALVGDYATMVMHVERAGVLVVDTIDELIDTCEILVRFPQPPVKGPAVLTASGAIVALVTDSAEALGLDLPDFEPATLARLRELLPSFSIFGNPLDITTAFSHEALAAVTKTVIDDPNVGSLFVISAISMPVPKMNEGMASSAKPSVLVMLGDGSPLRADILDAAAAGPAVFSRSADRTLRAVANYTRYGSALARSRSAAAPEPYARVPAIGRGLQPEWFAKRVFAAAGIRIPAGDLAHSVEEAIATAERVGYPVVLKAQAAALAHKTEAGGVMLSLPDANAVRSAWDRMQSNVARAAPDVVLDGVLVEKMEPKGLELMVGAKRDPAWGTTLLLGLGGIWVEALGDVQLLPDDANEAEIVAALRRLRSAKLLDGFRGAPPVDVAAVAATVSAIARLMRTVPEIVEIDVNPLLVHAAGHGATALDALIAGH